jgi:hypothetical protein
MSGGPFLSRNDFAGFVELSFPAALWLAMDRRTQDSRLGPDWDTTWEQDWVLARVPLWVPAWMLAAGLTSDSRAGAILLLAEAGVVLGLISKRRAAAKFVLWTVLLAAVAGRHAGGAIRRKRSMALPAKDRGVDLKADRGPSLARLRAGHLRLCLSGLRNFRYRRRGGARA